MWGGLPQNPIAIKKAGKHPSPYIMLDDDRWILKVN
jgi:hypothetical protein